MTDDELDLVETDALVAALHRRYDAVVIGAVASLNKADEERVMYWRGGFVGALGITAYIQKRLDALIVQAVPEDEADEDGE